MTTTKKILAALIAAPLMLGSATAFAEEEKSTSILIPYGMKFLFEGVELTEEQQGQILVLGHKNRKANKKVDKEAAKQQEEATKAKLAELEQQMQEVVLLKSFDEKAVQEIARKMADASIAKNVAKLREQHEFVSLMNDEQKALIKANIAAKHKENQEKKLTF